MVNRIDYALFLQSNYSGSVRKNILDDLHFWESRVKKDSGNFVTKLEAASAHLRLFHLLGNVNHLHSADSLLKTASAVLANSDPEILFSISQNSITQHRFTDAINYNNEALKASGDPYIHILLEFDGMMEIGNYGRAGKILERIQDKTNFQYLIRKAKLVDHQGNSTEAIHYMEEAFTKVKTKNKSLFCWALSNLGDMYSHSGRVKEAYDAYLTVLKKDPGYLYALKSIAWLAFSHDKNIREAKQIFNFILSQTSMPDLWLHLAEMGEWNGNANEKKIYLNKFLQEVTKPEYENMYNKYLIMLYCDEFKRPGKALALAKEEIQNRATPETYGWLAWAFLCNGEKQKAEATIINYVYGKTFEPETLYHMALIFNNTGRLREAEQLLKQCLESSIELGPVKIKYAEEILKKLETI